jgi:succinate-acetate transporter protein
MKRREVTVVLLVVWIVYTLTALLGFLSQVDARVLVVIWIALFLALTVCRFQAYERIIRGTE